MRIGQAAGDDARDAEPQACDVVAGEAVLSSQRSMPSIPAATRAAAAMGLHQHVHQMEALAELVLDDRRLQPSP